MLCRHASFEIRLTREGGGTTLVRALDDECVTSLLEEWMLPEESEAGLMVLSYLDKPPFASSSRYAASHTFADFHEHEGSARATVMLYASRELPGLRAAVAGALGWSMQLGEQRGKSAVTVDLPQHADVPLYLDGPLDLAGRQTVTVTLTTAAGATCHATLPLARPRRRTTAAHQTSTDPGWRALA
jgi:hypothetical protein